MENFLIYNLIDLFLFFFTTLWYPKDIIFSSSHIFGGGSFEFNSIFNDFVAFGISFFSFLKLFFFNKFVKEWFDDENF